jgi:hypothetical protein
MGAYSPPVNQLLTLGDCGETTQKWPDYPALGLGPEHVPDLIRLATDRELLCADLECLEVWAPIHAWRALGQLRTEAAIEPLMRLFHELDDDDLSGSYDWVMEEMPEVYGLIGPAAIPALTAYLANESHDLYPRTTALNCLEKIGKEHPEARAECVAALTRQLEQFDKDDPELNAFLVSSLISLKAVEAASVIEGAFAAGCVDQFIAGDWEDAQVDLGLKAARDRPRRPSPLIAPPKLPRDDFYEDGHARPSSQERSAKKAKRKQAKLSRKINRKKRKRK